MKITKILKVNFTKRGKDLHKLKKERQEEKYWEKIENRIRQQLRR